MYNWAHPRPGRATKNGQGRLTALEAIRLSLANAAWPFCLTKTRLSSPP